MRENSTVDSTDDQEHEEREYILGAANTFVSKAARCVLNDCDQCAEDHGLCAENKSDMASSVDKYDCV